MPARKRRPRSPASIRRSCASPRPRRSPRARRRRARSLCPMYRASPSWSSGRPARNARAAGACCPRSAAIRRIRICAGAAPAPAAHAAKPLDATRACRRPRRRGDRPGGQGLGRRFLRGARLRRRARAACLQPGGSVDPRRELRPVQRRRRDAHLRRAGGGDRRGAGVVAVARARTRPATRHRPGDRRRNRQHRRSPGPRRGGGFPRFPPRRPALVRLQRRRCGHLPGGGLHRHRRIAWRRPAKLGKLFRFLVGGVVMVFGRFRLSAIPLFASLALAALAVSGCSTWTDVKRGLGMEKVVPDEFDVQTSAPLAIPPDYTLRPPKPGAAPTQQLSPTAQAQATIFRAGDNKLATLPPDKSRSAGENALLKDAGAAHAPKDIRQLLTSNELTERLLFWRSTSPNPNQVLDPSAEAERLRQFGANGGPTVAANGQAATTTAAAGPKPTIERAKQDSKGF